MKTQPFKYKLPPDWYSWESFRRAMENANRANENKLKRDKANMSELVKYFDKHYKQTKALKSDKDN